MENRSYALAAGVFVLVMGAALALTVWWFAEEREETRDYILVSKGNIDNLNVHAGVRFRGMAAGRVTDIRLDPEDPRNILVHVSIRKELPVTRGTTAKLASQGVTGIAYIQLEDFGDDPRPLDYQPDKPPRLPLKPSDFTKITEATMEAMQGLETMSRQLDDFLSEENRGRFDKMVVQLEAIVGGVDQSLAEMPATLEAIQGLASPENRDRLAGLLENFEQVGAEAVPAVQELRKLLASLDAMSARVETVVDDFGRDLHGAGDHLQADTLPRLDRLLEDLSVGSRRLGYFLEELEQSPQLLLRGRGEREPGPGESGR